MRTFGLFRWIIRKKFVFTHTHMIKWRGFIGILEEDDKFLVYFGELYVKEVHFYAHPPTKWRWFVGIFVEDDNFLAYSDELYVKKCSFLRTPMWPNEDDSLIFSKKMKTFRFILMNYVKKFIFTVHPDDKMMTKWRQNEDKMWQNEDKMKMIHQKRRWIGFLRVVIIICWLIIISQTDQTFV